MKRVWLCIIVCMVFCLACFGQDAAETKSKNPTILGLSFDYGHILKHAPSLRAIDDAYPIGITAEWSKLMLAESAWNICNCFPRLGVDLSYWNFDNTDVLGHGALMVGYLEPYFGTKNRTNFFVRAGMGAAYLSKPYDEQENPLNESYSTYLSFAILVGLGVNYRLTDSWNLRLAAKYNHTSNGGVRTPNKGLNFPSISVGVNKSLTPVEYPNYNKSGKRQPPDDKSRISLVLLSGWSNAAVGDKDKFLVWGLMGNYGRWIGSSSALTGGMEWVFDYSRREQIKVDELDKSFAQGSLLVGHEFWWGKVTFSQQLGVYFFNEYRNTDDVYQRYGLTYTFGKHFFGGFNLKVHRHVADFFDLRVGYIF